jgi:hypothetical protein
MMKDVRNYQRIVADAETRGVPLVERSATSDPSDPQSHDDLEAVHAELRALRPSEPLAAYQKVRAEVLGIGQPESLRLSGTPVQEGEE